MLQILSQLRQSKSCSHQITLLDIELTKIIDGKLKPLQFYRMPAENDIACAWPPWHIGEKVEYTSWKNVMNCVCLCIRALVFLSKKFFFSKFYDESTHFFAFEVWVRIFHRMKRGAKTKASQQISMKSLSKFTHFFSWKRQQNKTSTHNAGMNQDISFHQSRNQTRQVHTIHGWVRAFHPINEEPN